MNEYGASEKLIIDRRRRSARIKARPSATLLITVSIWNIPRLKPSTRGEKTVTDHKPQIT